MTGEEILAITEPGVLFPGNPKENKLTYKNLARKWHPDYNKSPIAHQVFCHIGNLWDKIRASSIDHDNIELKYFSENFNLKPGITGTMKYFVKTPTEYGEMFIGRNTVAYVFNSDKLKYFDNYKHYVTNLKYPDSSMKEEMEKYFPKIEHNLEFVDGRKGFIINKTEDVLSLRDVLKHFNNQIPDKTAAWILSSLYNISSYLYYSGIVHNGITVDNYFISPQYHSGLLLGGWQYACKDGEKMVGCTKEIYDILPFDVKKTKIANFKTDLESIRLLGRTILGDSSGRKLPDLIPEKIKNWMNDISLSEDSISEYQYWQTLLETAYGKRKFIPLSITYHQLYGV